MRNSITNNTFLLLLLFFFLLLFPHPLCIFISVFHENLPSLEAWGAGDKQPRDFSVCLAQTLNFLRLTLLPSWWHYHENEGNKGFSEEEMKVEVWNSERKEGKVEKWKRVLTRSRRWVWGLRSFFLFVQSVLDRH